MRMTPWRSLVGVLLLGLLAQRAGAAELAVGSPAPPFRLPGSDGESHSLEDYLGKREVVLAWFPKAFTPG